MRSIFDRTPAELARLENDVWSSLCERCPMRGSDERLAPEHRTYPKVLREVKAPRAPGPSGRPAQR